MFRELRRQDRSLSKEQSLEILRNEKFGILSLFGEDGYPYGVPIHYVMIGDSLFFHCSLENGHKVEAIKKNSNISFTVVETENGVKAKSVIIFGNATEVVNKRQFVLEKIVEKFVPEVMWENAKAGIPYAIESISAFEINYKHISGKWIDKPEGK